MKKTVLMFLILNSVITPSFAETTFIVRNRQTKEVLTISNKNDNIISPDYEVIEIHKKIDQKDLPFNLNPTLYVYDQGEFKPNIEKINKLNDERKKWDDHLQAFQAAKVSARNRLKALCFTKPEIDAIFHQGDYLEHKDGEQDIEMPPYREHAIVDTRKLK